jgi:hypothetical protein
MSIRISTITKALLVVFTLGVKFALAGPLGPAAGFGITDARAALSSTAPVLYSTSTGVIAISSAGASSNGYLKSTDWNTFNTRLSTITFTSPLSSVGGNVSLSSASANQNGYLTSTDWATFNSKQALISAGTTSQYWRGDKSFQTLDTSVVPENSNLYFTTARARLVVSASSPTAYNTSTGVISLSSASATTNGYLTSANWIAFNAKQAVFTAASPLSFNGSQVSISSAGASSNGALTFSDWNTFNNKISTLTFSSPLTTSGTTIGVSASSVTLQGNTFNGNSQLMQTTAAGKAPAIDGSFLTNLAASHIAAGSLGGSVIASSIAVTSVGVPQLKFTGTPSAVTFARGDGTWSGIGSSLVHAVAPLTAVGTSSVTIGVDPSSVTLQGNIFNGTSQLVKTDGSGNLPALDGSALTNLTATNLAGTVPNARLDSSSITKQGNSFNGASQLVQTDASSHLPVLNASALTSLTAANLSGTVPNSTLDASSVTKQGNTFNGNSQLVQTTSGGLLPALSAANLISIPAGNLTGTVPNSTLDASSVTKQGNTFNTGNSLVQLTSGLLPNSLVDASSVTKQGNSFNGASQLMQLSASALVPNANIDSSSITKQGNVFNGASQLVQLNGSTQLPALSGVNLTNLNASNLASGTVADARLDNSSVTLQANVFNGNSQLVQTNSSGQLPAISGVNLTNLNASNLASGTVGNARLDNSSVTLQGNTFNTASKLVQLDATGALPAVSGANLTGVTTTSSTNTWTAQQTFSSATVTNLNSSTGTFTTAITSYIGTTEWLNHRNVNTASGHRMYTDIGVDPFNDAHIFQTSESWPQDNSTGWVINNSSDGYSTVAARTFGTTNNTAKTEMFYAGSGANFNWVTGVPIKNSGGFIVNQSSNAVFDTTSSSVTFLTECAGCAFNFYPNFTYAMSISSFGLVFPDLSQQTIAYNPITAQYSSAAGQSVTASSQTVINFGTSVWDTNSAVTTGANWHFTAPVSGRYRVMAVVQTGSAVSVAGNLFQMSVWVNEAQSRGMAAFKVEAAVTTAITLDGTTVVSLSAGDRVAVRFFQNSSGGTISLDTDPNFIYVVITKES